MEYCLPLENQKRGKYSVHVREMPCRRSSKFLQDDDDDDDDHNDDDSDDMWQEPVDKYRQ